MGCTFTPQAGLQSGIGEFGTLPAVLPCGLIRVHPITQLHEAICSWFAFTENDAAAGSHERRLWDAADQVRANSGPIADHANVFASLEKARAIYGAGKSGVSPLKDKAQLVAELRDAVFAPTAYRVARGTRVKSQP